MAPCQLACLKPSHPSCRLLILELWLACRSQRRRHLVSQPWHAALSANRLVYKGVGNCAGSVLQANHHGYDMPGWKGRGGLMQTNKEGRLRQADEEAFVGILHDNKIIFTKGHGTVVGNQPNLKPRHPGPDTVYGIGSMTKSFVVACLAKVRWEGKKAEFEWSTPMKDLIDGFNTDDRIQHLVTLSDFLSHRTGLNGDMSIAHQGDQEFLLVTIQSETPYVS
ncbi:hypothetical protein B0H65DRAFT_543267 [Neurospora tetraspora]|uniref:Beta-lactamase-related domain-containing protein n=1 Tax=Neurospora tetraspora TaxID=94610 RepID=A0AAE0J0I2_9PEZI|nr:hypothetical protein B0H65DRAFT_543267 [Neurospora tetraspora]